MELKQHLRLTQQLVMTPQLQQAIRLLQLSRLELIDEVRKELDNNPVLSDEEPGARTSEAQEGAPGDSRRSQSDDQPIYDTAQRNEDRSATEQATREVDWEKFLENRTLQQPASSSRSGFEELPPIEQNLTRPSSLQDHLL